MLALYIIGGILLFFLFLLSIKVTVTIAYHEEFSLFVKVLGIRIRILPKKEKRAGSHAMSAKKAQNLKKKLEAKKTKKAEKKRKKAEKKAKKESQPKQKSKKSLADILDVISLVKKIAAKVISTFWRHLRIDVARLHIRVATGDAATTALAYGTVTQAINVLFPLLKQVKNFDLPRHKDIQIYSDFTADSMDADIELSFALRVWHVFHVAFGALFTLIRHQVNRMIANSKKESASSRSASASQKPPTD